MSCENVRRDRMEMFRVRGHHAEPAPLATAQVIEANEAPDPLLVDRSAQNGTRSPVLSPTFASLPRLDAPARPNSPTSSPTSPTTASPSERCARLRPPVAPPPPETPAGHSDSLSSCPTSTRSKYHTSWRPFFWVPDQCAREQLGMTKSRHGSWASGGIDIGTTRS